MNKSRGTNAWSEVVGFFLLIAGILLFLSLVSYDTGDIPRFAPIISSTSSPNTNVHNLVGVLGAICGGYALFFFGIAAFWLATLFAGLGFGKLIVRDFSLRSRMGWVFLNIIAAACLVQLLPAWFENWKDYFHAHGTGGFTGYWLGKRILGQLIGVGSVPFIMVVYATSLILTAGFHPIDFIQRIKDGIKRHFENHRQIRLAQMDDSSRMAMRERELMRKTEQLEKKIKKTKPVAKTKPETNESVEEDSAFSTTPAPKIIDTSLPVSRPYIPKSSIKEKESDGMLSALHLENYELPHLDLLDSHALSGIEPADPAELRQMQDVIIDTLQQFNIEVRAGDITKGPTITRYELYPAQGVRVDRITALERNIALATKAERINILAPIPGKDTVGIELANSKKVKVILRELFESEAWVNTKAKLPIALGKDVYGNTIIGDLAQMPHCLVAGTTGSGKSVCINAIIASLLFRHSPEELRFIMIDPKVVELQQFNALPHLVTPVVTDPQKVLLALRWVIDEMEKRYKIFAKVEVRNIAGFNSRPRPKTQAELDTIEKDAISKKPSSEKNSVVEEETTDEIVLDREDEEDQHVEVPRDSDFIIPDRMPYIVVIVDELADLMQTAPADMEGAIARITQMARAAGIHMIVATQTPRADVVTGIIKANIPTRIAFQVASKIDSRVILDENGAEKLLGQGDMLYLPPGTSKFTRSQGVLVTDEEMKRVVEYVAKQSKPSFEASIHEKLTSESRVEEDVTPEDEILVDRCLEIIKQERKASTSMLQRRLRLGYTRAARVVDILEQRGILGPKDGAKDREILVDLDTI